MLTNYEIITDEKEFNKFLQWLPVLDKDETFYCSLLARHKYVKDLGIGTPQSDKHQCSRFATTTDRLPLKVKQLECPIGSYAVKGVNVPQEALAFYMAPNPRSQKKASQWLLKRLADVVADNEPSPNVYQESLTAIHKSVSRKVFVDVDFDIPRINMEDTISKIKGILNPDAVDILVTRGGFHALIQLDKIEKEYVKSWYKNITSLPGADIVGDMMIPVPGTYQGGFTPFMFKLSES